MIEKAHDRARTAKDGAGKKVLIVEDEEDIRELVRVEMLDRRGVNERLQAVGSSAAGHGGGLHK